MNKTDLIVILGITATGKTKLAAHLAEKLDGEIISADSRQVYRGMDIGSGKDLNDFIVNGKSIPYHLIDIKNAGEEYNVFEFQKDFLAVFEDIKSRNKQAILCGGTGLYLEAVLKGYRMLAIPENIELRNNLNLKTNEELVEILKKYKQLHNTTDTEDKTRLIKAIEIAFFQQENEDLIKDFPTFNYHLFGIHFERPIIRERITARLKQRLENEDMIGEVKGLIKADVPIEKLKFYGLEYKLVTAYLLNEISKEELFTQLNIAIHQFAKRQATWYRKMEKNGFKINWIDGNLSLDEKVNEVLDRLRVNSL
ncbi:MAG: tRNA (adenosine(37)-N6)-dimethylallyltransferase MiaA [Vicingaceae bacterium]|nr:tRNA (adenosine(37)-N6)-dimethylallyltransferase MiaA [Vicingaceae bacterium]